MSLGIKRKKTVVDEPKIHFSWKEAKRQKSLLIWSGIIVIYGIIFYYLPLGGCVLFRSLADGFSELQTD